MTLAVGYQLYQNLLLATLIDQNNLHGNSTES